MTDTTDAQKSETQQLADTRTGWAEDRTVLANERTFAAWMRTGMASVALALGLKAVFRVTDYPILAKSVAEMFILCAIFIFWTAARRSRSTHHNTNTHDAAAQSRTNMTITSSVFILGAISTGIILWLL
ncbi:YidH family protein [Sulfitobacter geojensis]|uniref:YidH family protein n=1 Tax=Sulfitobacter geojensis TaxID=1342299 RepID=UPI003B8E1551